MPAKSSKKTVRKTSRPAARKTAVKKTVVKKSPVRKAVAPKATRESGEEIQISITRALLGIIAIAIFISFFLNKPLFF